MIATGSLRQKLLDLAVSGKLVPQNPNDEAASVWAEKIGAVPVCDGLFELPLGWSWCRLDTLCFSIADGDHQAPPQSDSGIPFLVISNVASGNISFANTRHVEKEYFDSLSCERIPKKGDILVTVTGSYGIVVPVRTEKAFCFQRHIAVLKTKFVENQFLIYFLRSSFVQQYFRDVATGTAQKTVGLAKLRATLIPLPPLEEQKRIVARLEELLALEHEIAADGAALDDLVTAARRKILDLAVSGKLVPSSGEWKTGKLGDVCTVLSGQDLPPSRYNADKKGMLYITGASNLLDDGVVENRWTESPSVVAKLGDFLLTCKGSGVGKCTFLDKTEAHVARQIMALRPKEGLYSRFLAIFVKSQCEFLRASANGLIPGIPRKVVLGLSIPLPPLAEQKAIVKRVDELMALLDAMKG